MDHNIENLRDIFRIFVSEREWDQFHTPKNLVMALAIEASELMEPFQWMSEKDSENLGVEKLAEVKDEIGDVFYYLVRLCDKLGINPVEAALEKLEKSAKKYPVDLVKGKSLKYNEYK